MAADPEMSQRTTLLVLAVLTAALLLVLLLSDEARFGFGDNASCTDIATSQDQDPDEVCRDLEGEDLS